MKTLLLISALLGAVLAHEGYFYSTDDSYDIDAVVSDPEGLRSLTDCFLDKKPCSKAEQSYRVNIPDALSHGCKRCTNSQKHMANTYLRALRRHQPKEYVEFLEKYDPQGSFIDNFAKRVSYY